MDKVNKKFFIIDGNAYIYRSYYAVSNLKTTQDVPVNAVYGFLNILFKLFSTERIDYLCVCFDTKKKTFRNNIYADYKINRKKMPDDLLLQLPFIKESLQKMGIKTFEMEGYEADDLIATIIEKNRSNNLETYIVTTDKDIIQLVDENIKILPLPKKEIIDLEYVKNNYGFDPSNMLDFLSITGDKADDIPGIKGIGEEGAKYLIKKYKNLDNILNNLGSVDEKYKNKILDDIVHLKLSRDLIKLCKDVPIFFHIDECEFTGLENIKDKNKLIDFFKHLEFFSLIDKIEKTKTLFDEKFDLLTNFNVSNTKFKDIYLTEINEYSDISENLTELCITFSEDLKTVYFYDLDQIVYRIKIEDICFSKSKLVKIFEKITHIYTDNAKNVYYLLFEFDLKYDNDIFDVLLGSYILDTSLQELSLVSKKFLGKSSKDINTKLEEICLLKDLILKELETNNLLNFYKNIELKFCKLLASVEKNGIKIDINYLLKFRDELNAKINSLVINIYKETGITFNLNSPKQLADVLFNKLNLKVTKKRKALSTSEEVLLELAKVHDLPIQILKYREIIKIINTYINPILEFVNTKNRIRTTFNYTNTNTGRLSSSNPNLQNIPVKTELGNRLRRAFVADKGYQLVSADYAQIDLVVLAHMSRDVTMCRAFLNNQDIHLWTATHIFRKGESLITQKERDIAKRINFGLVYGITPYGLSQDLDIPINEAKELIDLYFKNYSTLREYLDKCIKEAKSLGYVKTILGRKRYIPELANTDIKLQKFGERIALNTPIQGSSADILKKAMVDLFDYFGNKQDTVKILLQIHDEILFEIKEDSINENIKIIKQKMEETIKLNIPLRVNIKKGTNWAEFS